MTTTTVFQSREYQSKLKRDLYDAIRAGYRRPLCVLPTGGGKTHVMAEIIQDGISKSRRIFYCAHRQELIDQPSRKLDALGIDHGIIMANHWRYRPHLHVQVASVPTLVNRKLPHPPEIIFFDEAHRSRAASYQKIIDRYPRALVVGFTATPIRTDGKGLGNIYDVMICGPSVAELTDMGHLVPTRVFAPSKPDLAGVKKTGGDYNQGGLQKAMDKAALTGDIVEHWRRLAENRTTVLFAAGIEHSIHLRDAFRAAGVVAEHLDGETDNTARRALLHGLAVGKIQVLCSVGVLTEGWDCPSVSCCILARPTASTGLYLQMAGRVLRPSAGKTDCLILDHAGNTLRHGMVDEEREWSLDVDQPTKPQKKIDMSMPKVCPECFAVVRIATRVCACGYVFSTSDRGMPDHVDGNLEEITGMRRKSYAATEEKRRELYFRWVAEGAERGYKAGYAGAKYKAMFKSSPKAEWMFEASLQYRTYFNKQVTA